MSTPYVPPAATVPPTHSSASAAAAEPNYICGFWARVMAIVLDYIVLAAVVAGPGIAARHYFAKHSFAALMLGFAAALPYFAILNSERGKGQTIGKRALGIRVTDRNGELIPLSKSWVRAGIFLVPLIFSKFGGASRGPLTTAWTVADSLLAACVFAMFYLYVCNRRTRQTPHDLEAGTFVIQASAWPLPANAAGKPRSVVTTKSIWRAHLAILGALILVYCAGSYYAGKKMQSAKWFAGLTPIHDALLALPEVDSAGVMYQKNWTGGNMWSNAIVVTIEPGRRFGDDEAEAAKMAGVAMEASREASSVSDLEIVFQHGVDYGVFHWSWTKSFSHTPQEWRAILTAQGPSKAI